MFRGRKSDIISCLASPATATGSGWGCALLNSIWILKWSMLAIRSRRNRLMHCGLAAFRVLRRHEGRLLLRNNVSSILMCGLGDDSMVKQVSRLDKSYEPIWRGCLATGPIPPRVAKPLLKSTGFLYMPSMCIEFTSAGIEVSQSVNCSVCIS